MPRTPELHRIQMKAHYRKRREAGLCGQCGNPSKRFHKCAYCREMLLENRRKRPMTSEVRAKEAARTYANRAERKRLGLCECCGVTAEGGKFCQVCRERTNANARARYAGRRAA